MKNALSFCIICLVAILTNAQGFVDLGLPSGTLWKDKNESGFYNFDDAVRIFGENLPTKEQMEELKNSCQWIWTGSGYKVVGPNGNSIDLPAAGFRSCTGSIGYVGSDGRYWSSSSFGTNHAWFLNFYSDGVSMYNRDKCGGRSVHLVANSIDNALLQVDIQEMQKRDTLGTFGFVDLGLPSGTLWNDKNESGFYNFDDAVRTFGKNLPTKEQMEELKNSCQWIWTGSGYKVVGPNGNSIDLPAAGFRSCTGSTGYVGSDGRYWSSSSFGTTHAWFLNFYSDEVRMYNRDKCGERSVRLVKN